MKLGNDKIEQRILLYILMPFCLLVAFQNCQPGQVSSTATVEDQETLIPVPNDYQPFAEYTDIEYYLGGGLATYDVSNWSHSYSINVSSLKLDAKLSDSPNCIASRTLSSGEMMQIQNTFIAADVKSLVNELPPMIDGGVEVLHLIKKDPTTKEILARKSIYFSEAHATHEVDALYFAYPQELSQLMQSLVEQTDLLQMNCDHVTSNK